MKYTNSLWKLFIPSCEVSLKVRTFSCVVGEYNQRKWAGCDNFYYNLTPSRPRNSPDSPLVWRVNKITVYQRKWAGNDQRGQRGWQWGGGRGGLIKRLSAINIFHGQDVALLLFLENCLSFMIFLCNCQRWSLIIWRSNNTKQSSEL